MLTSKTELELFERSQLGSCLAPTLPSYLAYDNLFPAQRKLMYVIIGSLCCESAEEAKTLIPSLANKISDPDLQELLDDITKLRNFVE